MADNVAPNSAPTLIRLLRDFGWKTLAEGLSRILGLVFVVLLARSLGDEAFGLYSLPLALAGLLSVLLDFGSHSLIVRELARKPQQGDLILKHLVGLRLISSGVFVVILLACWPLFASQTSALRILSAGAILLGQSWIDTWIALLNAREQFRIEARLRFWLKLGLLLPQLLVLGLWPGIDSVLLAGAFAHLLFLPVIAMQLKLTREPVQKSWLLRLFKDGFGFWLANVSFVLYLKLDLVLLPLLGRSSAELGWYQAAIRIYELLMLGGYLLSMAAFPKLSALAQEREQFWPKALRWLGLSAGLGVIVALLGYVLSPWLPMLLGPEFTPAVTSLQWLCLSIPAVYINLFGFNLLGALNRQNLTAWATGLCLALNLGLNLWLVPTQGHIGAAISTLCADVGLCLLLLVLIVSQKRLAEAKS